MLIIERFDNGKEAKNARRRIVRAQESVDQVIARIWGEPVIPSARDSYRVIRDAFGYALAVDDPSIPEERMA